MLKWLQLLLCLYLVIVEATQELESQSNEQDILENTTSRQSLYETPTKQRSCGCFYHWICLRVCQEPEEEKQDDQTDTKLLARLKKVPECKLFKLSQGGSEGGFEVVDPAETRC